MRKMPWSGVLVTKLTASPQARELDPRGAVVARASGLEDGTTRGDFPSDSPPRRDALVVRYDWPSCDYRGHRWGATRVDAFWVEATREEAVRWIIPPDRGAAGGVGGWASECHACRASLTTSSSLLLPSRPGPEFHRPLRGPRAWSTGKNVGLPGREELPGFGHQFLGVRAGNAMGKQGLVAPLDQVGGLVGELVRSGELQDDLPGLVRGQGAGRAARADLGVLGSAPE